ncbi:MAG: 5-formyltetrahydrofolate cyclo-ligase [Atopobiaceae bacterium]|nr:5-formyltetrahydrofolate cyclo-ligase [Atopobiaceae bacterium]MBR3315981.1 5-formyltetrahydrofolate cyclo-ligase [Atopobiaceae bacterium]
MASSQGADASKASLLNQYLALCESMPKVFSDRIDGSVRTMLGRLGMYRNARTILFYLPIHEEIDTYPLIEAAFADGKRVCLPYLDDKSSTLSWYEMESLQSIKRGSRGLAAPPVDAPSLGVKDMLGSVCLVPGLVFDAEGYRVGYGAGYYDEFLAFYPGDKVGLVRSVQVSSNPLPHDGHDIPVDVLVTEGSIWHCRKM